MTTSLNDRFSDDNSPAFALLSLHPYNMLKTSVDDFRSNTLNFSFFYKLDMMDESELWYSLWQSKDLSDEILKNLDMIEVLNEADPFYPSVKKAIQISLAQPCGTATIERSFSTVRKVKTWLRSTMEENRLNGNKFCRK